MPDKRKSQHTRKHTYTHTHMLSHCYDCPSINCCRKTKTNCDCDNDIDSAIDIALFMQLQHCQRGACIVRWGQAISVTLLG